MSTVELATKANLFAMATSDDAYADPGEKRDAWLVTADAWEDAGDSLRADMCRKEAARCC